MSPNPNFSLVRLLSCGGNLPCRPFPYERDPGDGSRIQRQQQCHLETPGEKSSVVIGQTDDLGIADDELLLDSHSEKREGNAKRLLLS
ncbi:uncharacterized protein [Lolium perenne]|uniref:uncharacterized protein isoform X3 n=1 Tax=Lolium perenne TaxID=4522 RepID=UPI003A99A85F